MPARAQHLARLAAGMAAFLVLWQAVVWAGVVPRDYLPGVPEIAAALLELAGSMRFWQSEGGTLLRAAAGFAISVAAGIALALAGARWAVLDRALQPAVDILKSLPPSALVPLAIFAMGLGAKLYLFIIVFGGIWPVYICARNALSSHEPALLNCAAVFGYAPLETLWRVRVPAALPEIFAGVRLAAGACLISTVAVEMLAGQNGVGWLLFDSAFSLRTSETFALLVVAGLNGLAFNALVVGLRKLAVGWHDELAATAQAT
jgi:NitT/TauT family transport system permease protein